MYPHGYGNPFPAEHHYQDQQSMMQEPQDLHHHSYHPAQHYPPGFSSSASYPHPSSLHHPPGSWPFDHNPPPDAPPNFEYFQPSFRPPPPSTHQSFYPPPPDAYPPHQYGFPHAPSFEAHQHFSAQDTHAAAAAAAAAPTLGDRILSSLEHAFGRSSSGGEHSQPPSENTYARPASFDHSHSSSHSSSYHDNKPPHVHSAFEYSPGSSMSHHSSSYQESEPQIEEGSSVAPRDYTYSTTPPPDVELPKGQLVRVFCKSNRNYNLGVKDGRLTMVDADSENESQQWIRDDKYSIRVRDSCGHPAFMLINKASKMVLKHANDKWQEVQLTYYSPDIQDDDLFWTESQDFGEGFKTLRMASNTLRNLSVGRGNKFEDGSSIILDTWHKKDNQLWKVFPL